MSQKVLTLVEFIKIHGSTKISKNLGICLLTVAHWSNRYRFPKPPTARALIKLSKGTLTYDSIYGPYEKDFDLAQVKHLKKVKQKHSME